MTFHADPSTLPLLKSHAIDAVVDVNYDVTAWEMANAVAEHFARNTKYPAYGDQFTYPGLGDPLGYQIVTGANVLAGRRVRSRRRRCGELLHREMEDRGLRQVTDSRS